MRIEYLTSKLKTNCDTVEEFINFDSFRNSEYSKLDKKYASLQLENNTIQKKLKDYKQLENEIEDLKNKIEDKKKNENDFKKEIITKEKNIKDLEKIEKQKNHEIDRLEEKIKEIDFKDRKSKESIIYLKNELKKVESKFEKEVESNRIDAKHFERLKREKRDLADEIVNLQNDLNSLREKSDGMVEIFENSVNNNTTKKTKLKEKAKKLEKTIEELNITIADQKEMISTSNLSFHSISTEEIKGYFETSDLI